MFNPVLMEWLEDMVVVFWASFTVILFVKRAIKLMETRLTMQFDELKQTLVDTNAALDKIATETKAQNELIDTLNDKIDDLECDEVITQEQLDELGSLASQIKVKAGEIDALVPDPIEIPAEPPV